jgi:restriction endonuclease fold toxin 5 of polymorphic toxin system
VYSARVFYSIVRVVVALSLRLFYRVRVNAPPADPEGPRRAMGMARRSRMSRSMVLLLFGFLVGCSGTTRVVRLDTGEGSPSVHVPSRGVEPVAVDDGEFNEAVAKHARIERYPERPLEFARQLFGVPELSGWYGFERKSRRLFPLGADALQAVIPPADAELNRLYCLWCSRTWGPPPRDCLRLLVDHHVLDGDGKYALAMAIARGVVLGEMKESFGRMVNPEAVAATITGAMTMYLMLWLLPEPVSKGVAGLMTVGLVAWLGWDMVWRLIDGWRVLVAEVDRATTFEALRAAGEKFARVMGEKGARAFVMLATLAVGNTAAGMAAKMPTLPGAGQAAVMAEAQLNIRFTAPALAEVESVAINAECIIVALAPNATAMTARGSLGGGPGEWVKTDEYMSESSRDFQAQVTGAPKGHAYRVKWGDEEVDFDGFEQGILLEAKGTGYAQWIDGELKFFKIFEGGPKMLDQARRQFKAANGTPIRWIVAEEKLAGALRKMFKAAGLPIEVIHISPVPRSSRSNDRNLLRWLLLARPV